MSIDLSAKIRDTSRYKYYMNRYLADPENFCTLKRDCERKIEEAFKLIEAKKDFNVELARMFNDINVAVTNELKTSEVKWISAFVDWLNDVTRRLSESTMKEPKIEPFWFTKKKNRASETDAAAICFIIDKLDKMFKCVDDMNSMARTRYQEADSKVGQDSSANLEAAYYMGWREHFSPAHDLIIALSATYKIELARIQQNVKQEKI